MRRKFTPDVVSEIRLLVDQGQSCEEIAKHVGCTVGTLRVRCSQFGISLRRKKKQDPTPQPAKLLAKKKSKTISVPLSHLIIEQLRSRAQSKHVDGATLAVTLLERIVPDNLFEAVLDDGPSVSRAA